MIPPSIYDLMHLILFSDSLATSVIPLTKFSPCFSLEAMGRL